MEPLRVLPVNDFGIGGLHLDMPTTRHGPTQLTAGTNIRVQDGQLAVVPEPVVMYTLPKRPVFGDAFYQLDETGGHIFVYDDRSMVYVDSTGAEQDITPDTPPTTSAGYVGCQLNDIYYLTNGIDPPWAVTSEALASSGKLAPMVNWPENYTCRQLRPYKSHMVAVGVFISGVEQRSLVKWSHPSTPGQPDLFWNHKDATLLAGEVVLATSGRNIAGIQPLKDSMMIYLDQSVWRMDNTGGALVMSFTKVFTDDGAIGPEAFADYDGNAVVVGYSDIYLTDGFTKRSLSDGKVTRAFYRSASLTSDIKLAYYAERREVYIFYRPTEEYTESALAMVYNVDAGAFTLLTLPGPVGLGGVLRAYQGPKFESTDFSYDDAGAAGWTYDNQQEITYSSIRTQDENTEFFLLSGESQTLAAMDQQLTKAHRATDVYIEIERMDMSALFGGSTGDVIKYINRLFPQATGTGKMQISLGSAMLATAPIAWKPWATFDLLGKWAHDQRIAGRYLGIRFRMNPGNDEVFSLAGFDVQIMLPHGGRR